jgi:hypothetical protein
LDRAIGSVVTAVLLLRFDLTLEADGGRLYPFVFAQTGLALLHSLLKSGDSLLLFRDLSESREGN